MYLRGKRYLSSHNYTLTITPEIPDIKTSDIRYIVYEAGYWRKANQIHRWFVTNIQHNNDNCVEYFVSKDQLLELLDLVNRVLEDNTLAPTLLPTAP